MSCCGNWRRRASAPVAARPDAPVEFIYVGDASLTVIGGATGRKYHFDRTLCRLAVERRDVPSLSATPRLRRVAAPASPPGQKAKPAN